MDTSSWKWFRYDEIFTDISIGISKDLNSIEKVEKGGITYLSRSIENNGYECRVEVNEDFVTKGDFISVVMVGIPASAFYQPNNVICAQNLLTLRSPKMNIYSAHFLCTIIEQEKYRFSYGRTLSKGYFIQHKVKLPQTLDGSPDWQYMENYIKEKIIPQLPKKAQQVWQKQYDISPVNPQPIQLNTRDWQWFRYDEIFDIKHGFYNKKPEDNPNGDIPFIGATDSNNGVTSHSDIETIAATTKTGDGSNSPLDEKIFENCIAVTNNGSVGYAYYQEKRFTCTHDVNPLYLKGHKLNRYIALFLCTLIEKERFRWAYGRKWRPVRMPSSLIKLPVTPTGEPDWQFMEDYIKSLPYSRNIESTDPNELVNALQKKVKELEQQLQQQSHTQTPFTNYGTVNIIDNSRNYNIK